MIKSIIPDEIYEIDGKTVTVDSATPIVNKKCNLLYQ